jgi:hypothetical protein
VRRPRSMQAARPLLVGVAFLAAIGFFLVNIVDPYSGAAASPGFASAHSRFLDQPTQALAVAGSVTADALSADTFSSKAPPPKPVAAATNPGSSSSNDSAPVAGTPDPGSAQAYAQSKLAAQGMGSDQFSCLVALWNRESGWNVYAENPDGAYGIPQALPGSKMSSAGPNWESSYVTQVDWGLGYIEGRYGTPCGAWAQSQSTGWY